LGEGGAGLFIFIERVFAADQPGFLAGAAGQRPYRPGALAAERGSVEAAFAGDDQVMLGDPLPQ